MTKFSGVLAEKREKSPKFEPKRIAFKEIKEIKAIKGIRFILHEGR